jgi:hypothetical protein
MQISPQSQRAEYDCTPPIAVLSFNRPHYLRPVLESLRDQSPPVDPERVHLFQDGAVNAYSGIRYAQDKDIAECVEIFKDLFPAGHLHMSPKNVGISENYLRAERFVFLTMEAPVAYFFEDDLVLSNNYLAALDILRRSFSAEPRIGYFNACGAYRLPLDEQKENAARLINMGHLWGFGLRRFHWLDMQPLLEPYYGLVHGRDYRSRSDDAVCAWYRHWKLSRKESSEDAAKDLVTNVLGRWRASTTICLARYIGVEGVHCDEAAYARMGFAGTVMFDGPLPACFRIEPSAIDAAVGRVRRRCRREYKRQRRRQFLRFIRAPLRTI